MCMYAHNHDNSPLRALIKYLTQSFTKSQLISKYFQDKYMKLLRLFKYQCISTGLSSFSILFNYSILNQFSFEIDLRCENEENEWSFEITDFREQYARTLVKQFFPTALKFKMSSDEMYEISKKSNWELPNNYFIKNSHLFPTQEEMESELIHLKPLQFFIKNIWEKL